MCHIFHSSAGPGVRLGSISVLSLFFSVKRQHENKTPPSLRSSSQYNGENRCLKIVAVLTYVRKIDVYFQPQLDPGDIHILYCRNEFSKRGEKKNNFQLHPPSRKFSLQFTTSFQRVQRTLLAQWDIFVPILLLLNFHPEGLLEANRYQNRGVSLFFPPHSHTYSLSDLLQNHMNTSHTIRADGQEV